MVAWSDIAFYAVHICAVSSALFYGLASIFYLRSVIFLSERSLPRAQRALLIAVLLHAVFILEQTLLFFSPSLSAYLGFAADPKLLDPKLPGSAFSFSLIAWLLSLGYLLLRRHLPIHALGVCVAPLAMVLTILSAIWFHQERNPMPTEHSPLLLVHILFSILGHVAFIGAFSVSLVLIVQETLLKRKSFLLVLRAFPPLRVLDSLNSFLLSVGLLSMVLGVVVGVWFAIDQHSPEILYSARSLWSIATLSVYTALVLAIFIGGFRGRRAAWMSVIGFTTILCSFLSTHFFGAAFHVH